MSLVYLPVESSRRELVARAFLAARLAATGHSSAIFRLDMFVRVGWPAPGYYIGKHYLNAYPDTDLGKLYSLRAAGIRVWHLDEEGGIMHGESEAEWMEQFRKYLDLTQLGESERLLTWGEWQKEGWERLGVKAACTVTGTPNFDVYQQKYHEALEAFDIRETGGREGYVLVNTRFATANALNNFGGHIIHDFTSAHATPLAERFRNLAADGVLLHKFVELIGVLAQDFPDETFVVRPHPAEDPATYQRLFAPVANIVVTGEGDAGSWIRRSKCMIHNGCTTAIQAAIAGKPVITYVPDENLAHFTAALPNRIGVLATSIAEVAAAIRHPASAYDPRVWDRTVSNLDAIERIGSLVDEAPKLGSAADVRRVASAARKYDRSEIPRSVARWFLPAKRESNRLCLAALDRKFLRRFPELVQCAADHFATDVRVSRPSSDCFVVEPARPVSAA